jgi:N-methylhydantoinase B
MEPSKLNNSVHLQIIWSRLLALVEEQAQVLKRTAFSPLVRACGDLSVGLFDLQARMLVQAVTGTPGHVNTMAESVKHFIRRFPIGTMKADDAYITNDPWMGTGHLNDFVVVTPCFHNNVCVALLCCTSHMMDLGGLGAGTEALDVFAEGLYIPMLKLIDEGVVNETLVAMIGANSRIPVDTIGDTYSLAACNDVGVKRLQETFAEFSLSRIDEVADYIVQQSRDAMVRAIAPLPKGTWHNEVIVDGYNEPLRLRAALTISPTGIHVDFRGSANAISKGINCPLNYAAAYSVFGVMCVIAKGIPNNAGSLMPITISAPEGSVVNAIKPSPVGARHVIGQMLPDLVFGCLSQVLPESVPAEGSSCMWNIAVRGRYAEGNRKGQAYSLAVTTSGGTGALFHKDGLSATAFPSGIHCVPIEIAETQIPILFRRKELRTDSAGAGRTRGGMGQVIELEHAENGVFQLSAAFERISNPARGRHEGLAGCAGYVGFATGEALPGKGLHEIPPGARLIMYTPGGGGMGKATERAPDLIVLDLIEDRVSYAVAERVYGALKIQAALSRSCGTGHSSAAQNR